MNRNNCCKLRITSKIVVHVALLVKHVYLAISKLVLNIIWIMCILLEENIFV